MIKHVVNLRAGARPVQFADRESELAYDLEVEELRARQAVQYAVAPRVRVSTLKGLLSPGDEVRVDDIEAETGSDGYPVPPRKVLERMVARGLVLEKG